MMDWLMVWCPECGYRKIVMEWTNSVAVVAVGEHPHKRPSGGDCHTLLNTIGLSEGGERCLRKQSLVRRLNAMSG